MATNINEQIADSGFDLAEIIADAGDGAIEFVDGLRSDPTPQRIIGNPGMLFTSKRFVIGEMHEVETLAVNEPSHQVLALDAWDGATYAEIAAIFLRDEHVSIDALLRAAVAFRTLEILGNGEVREDLPWHACCHVFTLVGAFFREG